MPRTARSSCPERVVYDGDEAAATWFVIDRGCRRIAHVLRLAVP